MTESSMRTVLMIAFHFPPIAGSSGMQRTLRFAQYLPKYGWRPIILTVNAGAHDSTSTGRGNEVPPALEVHRSLCLNAAKHLSMFGRYPQFAALPDRWSSWRLTAVRKAMTIISNCKVDAIWSTFPIPTTHQVALTVARKSGLPWIAEFRDPMWQVDWPTEPATNSCWKKLEADVVESASKLIFVAPNAETVYAERFPHLPRSRLSVIENGYDEQAFINAGTLARQNVAPPKRLTLLHSGIIYQSERDPTHFFQALANLKRRGQIADGSLRIILRASYNDAGIAPELARLGITDIVELGPPVNYLDALREMQTVDGLLLLQASNCNAQIPAKLYEYVRAAKPILALTDPVGDTAGALHRIGTGMLCRLDSTEEIEAGLLDFLEQIRSDSARITPPETVRRYSRESQTGDLAAVLNSVVR
jgi:hypothetical protein